MRSAPEENKVVVVLGSPRSGTSLTAGVLSVLGVDMGDVRPPDSQNPTGYYEDRAFLSLGRSIFQAADENASGFQLPKLATILDHEEAFKDRIKALILHRINECKGSAWGWKTTHSNLTLPLFMPYLPNPCLVIVFRNPLSIAKSVVKFTSKKSHLYSPLDLPAALRVVHTYYEHVYRIMERYDLPTLLMSYEDLTSNPASEVARLSDFIGLEPTKEDSSRAIAMVASKAGLRRAQYVVRFSKGAARLRRVPKELWAKRIRS